MSDLGAAAAALAASAAGVAALMGATLAIAVRRDRHRIVDVTWGLGFALVAVLSATAAAGSGDPARTALLVVLPVAWGARLAVHVARRNHGAPEDPRYEQLLARSTGSPVATALRAVYLPQAAVMLVVATPVPVGAATAGPLPWWGWLGVAVWCVGLFFEAVGDEQLARFRDDPANRGRVMDRGLWRYTRHPNYFGDACVWWGVWLVAAGSWAGAATIVSPVLMTYLLVAKTGKALLEKGLSASKPGYADYVARTSGFVPLPPRRRAHPRG